MKSDIPFVVFGSNATSTNLLLKLMNFIAKKLQVRKAYSVSRPSNREAAIDFAKEYPNAIYVVGANALQQLEDMDGVFPKEKIILVSKVRSDIKKARELNISFFKREKGEGYYGLYQNLVVMLS